MTRLGTEIGTETDTALSAQLREGTREDHARAESTPFVADLMAGRLDVAAYADLAAQQHAVYVALEAAGAALGERGASVALPALARVPAIESDLARLWGPAWRDRVDLLPATRRYAERLREVASTLPGYVAHAYTRYLGDLSGGQIIKRMLARHYGLADDVLAFYTFDALERIKPFKDEYRARIDALELTGDERRAVVAEARGAFDLNRDVFAELGARHAPAP